MRHSRAYLPLALLFASPLFAADQPPEGRLIQRGHVVVGLPATPPKAATQSLQAPPAPCALQSTGEYPGLFSAAATDYTYHLRSTGNLRGLVLFIEFPNARTQPTDKSTQTLYEELGPPSNQMLADLSFNKLRIDLTPIHKWYLLPRDYNAYPMRTYGDLRTFYRDVIAAADADVAFNSFDFVTLIASQSAPIDAARAFVLLPDVAAQADGANLRFLTIIPNSLRFPDVLAHEHLHLLGLQDLYLLDANTFDEALQPFGRWDLMSAGLGLTAWHKEKLGWIEPSQITCLSTGAGESTLTPVHTPTGNKAAVVPISPTRAFVLEARQSNTLDPGLCESGVLLYSVDSTIGTGDGAFRLRPAKTTGPALIRSCLTPEPNAYAAFETGPGSVSHHFEPGPNLLFEVTAKQQFNYTVRVRTIANPAVLPRRLVKVSGDNQLTPLNRDIALPLTVRVLDANGQPVPNPASNEFLPVRWSVIAGSATITNTASDANGNATATLRTGNSPATIGVRVSSGTVAEFFTIRIDDTRPVPSAVFNGATLAPLPIVAAAPDSWVVLKGTRLAATTQVAEPPYPETLAGTSVTLRDSRGTAFRAPLYFVSPGQLNFLIPSSAAAGTAQLSITTPEGTSATTQRIEIRAVAPGLFTANATGSGVAAGFANRLLSSGDIASIPLFAYDEAARTFRNLPLDLGSPSEPLYLVLYGTGFRNRSSLDRVRVSLRGLDIPVLYAGPQGQFPGLDQINIGPLPPELRNAGQLAFQVEVEGELSNRVTIDVF